MSWGDAFNKLKELPIPDPIDSLIDEGKKYLIKKTKEYLIKKAGEAYEAIKEQFKDAIRDSQSICEKTDVCDEKIQKQFKKRYNLMNYGYWCGGNNAPAKQPVNLEPYIPEDESKWDDWIKEKCLPAPVNKVDRACMLHDLRLGRIRQIDPNLDANSKHPLVYDAHKKLQEDFKRERDNPENDKIAMTGEKDWFNKPTYDNRKRGTSYAYRGEKVFYYHMMPKTNPEITEGLQKTTGEITDRLQKTTGKTIDILQEGTGKTIDILQEVTRKNIDKMQEDSNKLVDAIQSRTGLGENVNRSIDNAQKEFDRWVDRVQENTSEWVDRVQENTSEWVDNTQNNVDEWVDRVQENTSEWVDNTQNNVDEWVDRVQENTSEVFDRVQENTSEWVDNTQKNINDSIDNTRKEFREFIDNLI